MLTADGEFRYEIRRGGELLATEEESLRGSKISGYRHAAGGSNVYEVEAELDAAGLVRSLALNYRRGPFVRKAVYESVDDFLRGSLSVAMGRGGLTTKLGRYREIDADLIIFRAIIIAHIRARGQTRWTGRVAAIDSNTLVATTSKQSCRLSDRGANLWIYEARMGEREEIELDPGGQVIRRRDSRGFETVLVDRAAPGAPPAPTG